METFCEESVTEIGADAYSRHPTFEVLMAAYTIDDGPMQQWIPVEGQPMPADLEDALRDPQCLKYAWNKTFEWSILENHLGIHTEHHEWRDPMVLAFTLSFPGKLEKVGPLVGLPMDKRKDARGKALIRKFCGLQKPNKTHLKPWRVWPHMAPKEWEEFLEYNRQDVVAETAIWKRIKKYDMPAHEWENWFMDQEINQDGIPVNARLVQNAIEVYESLLADRFKRMREITGLKNPNSQKVILEWLKKNGYPYDDCQKGHIRRALDFFKEPPAAWSLDKQVEYGKNKELKRVLELRLESAKSSPKKYATLFRHMDVRAGVIRNCFQFAGAGRTWRWSGRAWQAQNLSKPTKDLEKILPSVVRHLEFLDAEALELVYEKPFDVLSSCVRPVVQAPDGFVFADVDLSAIENRVLGWMSNCHPILDVFKKGQDPYIAFATKLFHKSYEELWHEYKVLGNSLKRTISKPGVLGAGYRLGPGEQHENRKTGEMEATGLLGYAWNMGVRQFTKEDSVLSVDTFRRAYPEVVEFWYAVERAAKKCITTGRAVDCWPVVIDMAGPFMRMRLPSGRYLHYFRPRIKDAKTPWGEVRPTITYEGLNDKKIWGLITTHGGKLTENCWNSDTLILTESGVKTIIEVTKEDRVWDGFSWVEHKGVVCRGEKETIIFGGAKATPEHRVETNGRWRQVCEVLPDEAASSFERHYGDALRKAIGEKEARLGRTEDTMALRMRLRLGDGNGLVRVSKAAMRVLRLFKERGDCGEETNARDVGASGLRRLEVDVGAVSKPQTAGVQELRGKRDRRLCSMGIFFVVLGGYVRRILSWPFYRAGEQQQRIFQGKLCLGGSQNASEKLSVQSHNRHTEGSDDDSGSIRVVWGRGDDTFVSEQCGVSEKSDVRSAGCVEPVYDILNCGLRSAFTVVLPNGRFILSHNCDQGMSRDLFVHGMRLAKKEGLSVRVHVHDQIVALVPEKEADRQLQILKDCMQDVPAWAKGLPLGSNGFVSKIFTKD